MAKTALVLSGGAMFGAYQAGAWSVLAQVFQPDLIAATSVGALNGWAIAGGIGARDLIARWRCPSIARLLTRRTPILAPFGIFQPAGLASKIDELMSEYRPRIPIGITAVEVPQFVSRLFIDGQITRRHILASCAVPVGFPPVRIGRRLYIDGGVKSSLPLWAAVQMGATRVIAINALPVLPSAALRLYGSALRALGGAPKPVSVEVIRIEPSRSLGTLEESTRWDCRLIESWIEQGRRDAECAVERLSTFAA